jgi:hypothetical protein
MTFAQVSVLIWVLWMMTLSELVIQHVCLVNAGFDLLVFPGCHQILIREFGIVDLVSILLRRTFASIGTLIDEMQSSIMAQFGDQVQTTLAHHLQGVVVAKVSIQHQIGDREQALKDSQLLFDHFLDALQLWDQLYLGLVPVLAAFGTTWFALDLGFLLSLALLFLGLGRCFLCFAADDLLHLDRVATSLLHINQRQRKDRNTGHHLFQETGKETIQTIGLFAGLGHHTFVTAKQVLSL